MYMDRSECGVGVDDADSHRGDNNDTNFEIDRKTRPKAARSSSRFQGVQFMEKTGTR